MDRKISIITVVLNNKIGFEQTIQSVFSQTYTSIEYIVIDGQSTDGTIDVIKGNQKKIDYWISEKDTGVYQAMNKGWKQATGEYCLFLNSGDFLLHEKVIEDIVAKMDEEHADVYYGDLFVDTGARTYVDTFDTPVSLFYFYYSFLPHQASFTSTQLLRSLNGFFENYSIISDGLFFLRAFLEGKKFKHISYTVSYFNTHGLSSNGDKIGEERKRALTNEIAFLKEDYKYFAEYQNYRLSKAHKLISSFLRLRERILKKKS